jgi:hypothetical protein
MRPKYTIRRVLSDWSSTRTLRESGRNAKKATAGLSTLVEMTVCFGERMLQRLTVLWSSIELTGLRWFQAGRNRLRFGILAIPCLKTETWGTRRRCGTLAGCELVEKYTQQKSNCGSLHFGRDDSLRWRGEFCCDSLCYGRRSGIDGAAAVPSRSQSVAVRHSGYPMSQKRDMGHRSQRRKARSHPLNVGLLVEWRHPFATLFLPQ